jgi:hypothetical protein
MRQSVNISDRPHKLNVTVIVLYNFQKLNFKAIKQFVLVIVKHDNYSKEGHKLQCSKTKLKVLSEQENRCHVTINLMIYIGHLVSLE